MDHKQDTARTLERIAEVVANVKVRGAAPGDEVTTVDRVEQLMHDAKHLRQDCDRVRFAFRDHFVEDDLSNYRAGWIAHEGVERLTHRAERYKRERDKERDRQASLEAFVRFVVSLDDSDNPAGLEARRSITLTKLVDMAREALPEGGA